jgi:AcrR family transcriptional regulator
LEKVNEKQRVPGRPRDDASGPALMSAARRLVIERGYNTVTIGMISKEAGVGRQTLYRRWPSKAELVLDAFLASASGSDTYDEGDLKTAIRSFLERLFANLQEDGPAIRNLIASAQSDPGFCSEFKTRFVRPRAQIVEAIFAEAIRHGEVPETSDISMAGEVIHGAFWYRLLQGEPLDSDFAERLSDHVVQAFARR